MQTLALAATIAALVGGGLLYLASPNQKWREHPLAGRWAVWSGGALLALSLVLLWQVAGTASAIFIFVTLLMAAWSILPLAFAWFRAKKDAQS